MLKINFQLFTKYDLEKKGIHKTKISYPMYQFSFHCSEQLYKRAISKEVVIGIIEKASKKTIENGVTIYQNIIQENQKTYLIRVFVNEYKTPPLIITAYKTSKIQKY